MKELKHYINGQWIESSDPKKLTIINPATQEVIARAPKATKVETEEAIKIAKRTFESGVWSDRSPQERAAVLLQIADKLQENIDELTELEVQNNGKTRREAQSDAEEAVGTFIYYAGLLNMPNGQAYEASSDMQTLIVKEPMGVAGLIVPWNFPLLMSVWKIAPALAAGNSILLKPAEITPMTAVKLFELMNETDLPKGAANLIMGAGSVVGQTIAESNDVDIVSFTGSTGVGRQIMQTAAGNMKKVSLELGGKSPNIIFDDTDLETAVDYSLFGIFMGSGQVCSSGSRILVQEGIYDEFVKKYVEKAKGIRVGPGNDKNAQMGAIVSEQHLESILDYIRIGKEEGATLALGGNRIEKNGLEKGFFIEPTIFTNVTSDMRIVREEIFGPVVAIQKFKDEEEAIKIANDTDFGLAGAVFSTDQNKALRVIKKVRAGITWVNAYHLTNIQAPWGGYKQSGIGRSLGTYGLDEYQETKQININLAPKPIHWFE
ncbi:aldehyde dehydrogenase family protein [Metabacillus sediminilitoris]|uniref:Aldehyde dehydrogenase family protein n=1 Tax=Metabacillus sediminilitoris TaxID=2567941 RepID=A0A4S4BR76_9BACI|nr:aldehyde dehydrogenase family protein [Metabacillus sediminilitoris]QGQ48689.1 aldehyde dehydrogenase family protein [Metabacillus sediminilitoris]THF76664.1 aldehyde dehydrogenase family protein [Metabacillus sediminilitoris]